MLKSVSLYTGARVINGIATLALLSLLTTMLSPEAYGAFALLFTFSVSLSTISYQWIAVSVFRFNNPQSRHQATLQGEVLRLYLFVSAILIVLAPMVFYFSLPEVISLPIAFTMVALTILAGLVQLFQSFATSSGQPVKYVIMSSGRSVVAIGLVGMVFIAGYQEFGALLAVTLSYFLVASFALFNLRQSGNGRDLEVRKRIIRYGLPLSVSAVAIIVIDFSDRYMLGVFSSLREVGMYSAAYNLSQQTTGALLSVVFLAVFPRISGAYENEHIDQVKHYAGMLLVLLLGLGGAISTCFAWYSTGVSNLVLGQDIATDAASLMPLISLAIFLGVLKSSAFDVPAKLTQHTGYLLAISLSMAATNVVLNLALIPAYGAFGAAYATLLTFAAGMIASLVRDYRFWLISGLAVGILKIIFAVVAMNAFLFCMNRFFEIPWAVGAFLSLNLYAGSLYLLKPIAFTKGI